ncbi:hypothetical protein LX66_3557 [Chitinophaga japonensis]|uniref:Bacteriophage lambda head decoration protein D n=2 Tax=Chitinophaga japonensis TaxID=104662 RepID=A0A562SYQ3_CHIJA|nr:hypothetical protein LX66_3557 [Chitinophaga japonensis]
MGLQIKKEVVSSGVPVFQTVIETAQGGFTLDNTGITSGATMPAGTPMDYDESTRKAKPLKTAEVYENAGGSATQYKVKKGSLLAVGDYVASAEGGAAYAITAIDATGADYDVLTVGTTIGAATAGAALFQSSATGASAAALAVTPKGLLYQDTMVETGADVGIVLRGTLYARRAPAAPAEAKTAMPLIIYSQSF